MPTAINDWQEVPIDDWKEVPINDWQEVQVAPEETFMQKTAPYVRPVLEFGGMIGGGIGGSGVGPAGTIAGAGIGYAAGKEAANLYDQAVGIRQPENLMTERGALNKVAETGQNFVEGVGLEAGGIAIGKGVGVAAKYATAKLPEKLYGSAIKAPVTKKWTEILPSKEVSKRMSAISAGLEKRIYPTEHGIATITQLEKQTRAIVDDVVNTGAAQGDVVATRELVDKGLKKAYERALKSSDPIGAKGLVDEIAEKFMAHGETIPTNQLNSIKRQLYDEVKWGGSEATALAGQIKTMGKKGLAHEAMVSLESFYPQIKELNKTDASYIALKEAVERATARIDNRDIVGLTTKVLGVRSIPTAIFEWTIGHPLVKSRLAFSLHSAGKAIGTVAEKRIAINALETEIKTISEAINKNEKMAVLAKEGDKTAQEYIAKHNKLSQEMIARKDALLKQIKVDEGFQSKDVIPEKELPLRPDQRNALSKKDWSTTEGEDIGRPLKRSSIEYSKSKQPESLKSNITSDADVRPISVINQEIAASEREISISKAFEKKRIEDYIKLLENERKLAKKGMPLLTPNKELIKSKLPDRLKTILREGEKALPEKGSPLRPDQKSHLAKRLRPEEIEPSGFFTPEEVAQRNMARGNQQSALFEQKRRGLLNRQ